MHTVNAARVREGGAKIFPHALECEWRRAHSSQLAAVTFTPVPVPGRAQQPGILRRMHCNKPVTTCIVMGHNKEEWLKHCICHQRGMPRIGRPGVPSRKPTPFSTLYKLVKAACTKAQPRKCIPSPTSCHKTSSMHAHTRTCTHTPAAPLYG